MAQQHTTTTQLGRGMSLPQRARRGTTVVAARGALRISGTPMWLGEQVIAETVDLHEGDAHVVAQAGWIAINALSDAEVVCITQEMALWPSVSRWCRTMIDGVRRGWQSIAPGAWLD